jgi:hypothetical protein
MSQVIEPPQALRARTIDGISAHMKVKEVVLEPRANPVRSVGQV